MRGSLPARSDKIRIGVVSLFFHTFNNRIRKIVIATGAVTTVAGDGNYGIADNATGTLAEFEKPYGITTDGTNLYVADSFNERIRRNTGTPYSIV